LVGLLVFADITGFLVVVIPVVSLQRIKGLQGPTIIVISFLYLNYKIPPPTLLSAIVY